MPKAYPFLLPERKEANVPCGKENACNSTKWVFLIVDVLLSLVSTPIPAIVGFAELLPTFAKVKYILIERDTRTADVGARRGGCGQSRRFSRKGSYAFLDQMLVGDVPHRAGK